MTAHVEQILSTDQALPVWVIYEGEREIARATSEADAERVRAGLDALPLLREYVALVKEHSDGLTDYAEDMDGDAEQIVSSLGFIASLESGCLDEYEEPRPLLEAIRAALATCPLCHRSIHDHAPDCASGRIGQVGC